MTAIIASAGRTLLARLMKLIGVPLLIGAGIYFGGLGWKDGNFFAIASGLAAVAIGVAYPFFLPAYRLSVTEKFIEEREYETRKVFFDDIYEISVRYGEVTIFSKRQKPLLIDNTLADHDRILEAVAGRLSWHAQIKFSGDPDEVYTTFHKSIPKDMGPNFPDFR